MRGLAWPGAAYATGHSFVLGGGLTPMAVREHRARPIASLGIRSGEAAVLTAEALEMALVQRELTVTLGAYVLAGIPIAALLLAGRMSPLYAIPSGHLARWWSRFALVIVAFAVAMSAAGLAA